jgi:hypothetical protein
MGGGGRVVEEEGPQIRRVLSQVLLFCSRCSPLTDVFRSPSIMSVALVLIEAGYKMAGKVT